MRPLSQLPRKAGRLNGYIYVIAFSNGVTKVGSTCDPSQRFRDHSKTGVAFGTTIVDWWISEEHPHYRDSEQALIGLAQGMGERQMGREYFTGIGFQALVGRIATSIDLPRSPSSVAEVLEQILRRVAQRGVSSDGETVYPLDEVSELTLFPITYLRKACRSGKAPHVNEPGVFGMTRPQIRALVAQHSVGGPGAASVPA